MRADELFDTADGATEVFFDGMSGEPHNRCGFVIRLALELTKRKYPPFLGGELLHSRVQQPNLVFVLV